MKNWKLKLKKFKLDPTLKWDVAEITDLNKRIIEMDGEIASGVIKEDKKPPHY